ncbi:hypothetical protein Micbo1qcDRAFT_61558 [Microdochium bolleyi]|uniref:Uncharacterized protein n=1 Tax=Microdochium bolleyi TaxID=196109 RepID=A0A136J5D7_9PEZI|nr:hypothetical protein Micbo1qcDRAFT_61558 [Microdochium bolleyi]
MHSGHDHPTRRPSRRLVLAIRAYIHFAISALDKLALCLEIWIVTGKPGSSRMEVAPQAEHDCIFSRMCVCAMQCLNALVVSIYVVRGVRQLWKISAAVVIIVVVVVAVATVINS